MDYNAINRALALFEDAILNDKVDELVNRDSLLCVTNEKDVTQFNDNIILALKTDEFKDVLRTDEFQGLYDITYSLPPTLQGGATDFFKRYRFQIIGKTEAWQRFAHLELVQQIGDNLELLDIGSHLLQENLRIQVHPHYINGDIEYAHNQQKGLLPSLLGSLLKIVGLFALQQVAICPSIQFKICNKIFDLDLQQFSKEKVTDHLSKYLIPDDYKNKIIHDTVQFSNELINPNFIAQNESWYMLYCLTSLHDYIFEKESILFNYIIEQRKQNGWIYLSFIKENPSLYMDPEELFLFCISAGSKVNEMRNFYNNNYAAIWHSYVTTLLAEKRQQKTRGIAERLREKLAKSLHPAENLSLPLALAAVPKTKKIFPYNKNLLGAIAWKKAEMTGRPYIDVFREAAEEWIDEDGNEITGEQLANNFYNSAKNQGGPQYFYDAKEKQLKIIKEEIKWQD